MAVNYCPLTLSCEHGYVGQFGVITDANGLLDMRARYYSPYLRRFLSEDPIGFGGGMNWWGYVGGNPMLAMDPLGMAGLYPVRQPTSVSSFFTQTLPDTGVALYKGVMQIPGQISSAGRDLRRDAQNEIGSSGDPLSANIGAVRWVIGTGLEFGGGAASVVKTPENVYHAAEYHASSAGWLGPFEQQKAVVENFIFNQALSNPGIAYDLILSGKEVEGAGSIGGGVFRSAIIANALASSFGGSAKNYTPLTMVIGAVNIYGGVRGEISSMVDTYSQKAIDYVQSRAGTLGASIK